MASLDSQEPSLLVDHYLRQQQELTAVERFASSQEQGDVPAQAKYYSSLMPATPPGEGQQYAFEVDLDACSGCKACVVACHALNGLDEGESWRDVGLLHGGSQELPVLQHVPTACHHCLDPACMHACPVDAYVKDPVTGIVKHLDDQCIGCQYCTFACPYDAPKYNRAKGIVRKCDMCSDRLAVGEAPACVQACPNGAIAIRVVDVQQVIEESETNLFLPGAPEPQLTLPTTSYTRRRVFPRNMLPADYYSVDPEHAHWPLVLMLTLTQLSVGAFLVERVLDRFLPADLIAAVRPLHSASALAFGLLALAASVLHLGRPLYAFRAIIGVTHSWLSREILAFGAFAGLAVVHASSNWMGDSPAAGWSPFRSWLGWGVALSGLAGVGCSVRVYQFTKREFWSGTRTGFKFLMTTTVLGIATAWLSLMLVAVGAGSEAARRIISEYGTVLCRALMVASALKLLVEASVFRHLAARQSTSLKRSAMLMAGALSHVSLARFAAGFLGGVFMPGFFLLNGPLPGQAAASDVLLTVTVGMLFVACLAGEILERYLFFTVVAAPRMPGGL